MTTKWLIKEILLKRKSRLKGFHLWINSCKISSEFILILLTTIESMVPIWPRLASKTKRMCSRVNIWNSWKENNLMSLRVTLISLLILAKFYKQMKAKGTVSVTIKSLIHHQEKKKLKWSSMGRLKIDLGSSKSKSSKLFKIVRPTCKEIKIRISKSKQCQFNKSDILTMIRPKEETWKAHLTFSTLLQTGLSQRTKKFCKVLVET